MSIADRVRRGRAPLTHAAVTSSVDDGCVSSMRTVAVLVASMLPTPSVEEYCRVVMPSALTAKGAV